MKTYEKVKEATYKYAIELCKIFIEQGLEEWESDSIGVLDWEMLIRRVMSKIPDIEEMELLTPLPRMISSSIRSIRPVYMRMVWCRKRSNYVVACPLFV